MRTGLCFHEALFVGGNKRKSVLIAQCDEDPKIQRVNFRNSSELPAVFRKPRYDERPEIDPCGLREMNEKVSVFYTHCHIHSLPFLPFGWTFAGRQVAVEN